MWEWIEFVLLVAAIAYFIAITTGWTCLMHTWQKHGPTSHMAHELKTGKITGWKRMWYVCDRCGARRHGEKIEE